MSVNENRPPENGRNYQEILSPRTIAVYAAIAVGSIVAITSCEGQDPILSQEAIVERCEKADIKVFPTDRVNSQGSQLHAPITERDYGTAVIAPKSPIGFNTARRLLYGKGEAGKLAFQEANPQLGDRSKVDEKHPAYGHLSVIDRFTISKNGDNDKSPETKSSVDRISKDTGIDVASIECLSGINSKYNLKKGDNFKVFVPRQVAGEEIKDYTPVVLRAEDDLQTFTQSIGNAAKQPINGVRPIHLKAGTILYKKSQSKSAEAIDQPNPNDTYEAPNGDVREFIDKYKTEALAVEKRYGVPMELVLAQAILESGYGSSDLAQKANNFHGLKANNQWNGPTYTKPTEEVVTKDEASRSYPSGEIIETLADGKVRIKVNAKFKKFASVQEGFLGYGDHLKNRGDRSGKYYADAFETKDPREFVKKLVDNRGKKYATEPLYRQRVTSIIGRVETTLAPDYQALAPLPKKFGDYPAEQQDFGTPRDPNALLAVPLGSKTKVGELDGNEEHFEASIQSLDKANPDKEGYEKFKSAFRKNDISAELEAKHPRNFGDSARPTAAKEPDMLALHFTANVPQANHYDGRKFAGSMVNAGQGTGVQYYINNRNEAYILSTRYLDHMLGYRDRSFGVEIAASAQADITPGQYEQALYLAAHFLIDKKHITPNSSDLEETVRRVVRGHADARIASDSHTDFPKPIVDAFNTRLVTFLKTIGY